MGHIELSYDDNGGAGSPAFVFVHGWTCDRSFFKPQYDHFGRDHRAVAVDLRGHGKSPVADDGVYSIEAFAGDVAALIESLNIAPAVVVGHSLGGAITNALTAEHPELVAAAVLVDPAPMIIADHMRPVFQGLMAAFEGPDGMAARAGLVDGMFMATDDQGLKAQIAATMATTPHEIAVPAIGSLFEFDSRAALARVTRPIAVISSDGPINDPAAMKEANPALLHSQTLGAGHFNQLLVPDQVNAMIEHFLSINGI